MAKTLTLKHRFTYQKPTEDQLPRFEAIRKAALRLARVIVASTPPTNESDAAVGYIELAVMLANKSIALEKFKRE
jgi:hypothetical protein